MLRNNNLSALLNQTAPSLFNSYGNAIISALPGQDRKLAVCLAIGRHSTLNLESSAFWVGGGKSGVDLAQNYLEFGVVATLKINVATLKEDDSFNVTNLRKGGMTVVTPLQYFNSLSRRWTGKKESNTLAVLGLVLLDGIHLINEEADIGMLFELANSRL